MQMQITESLLTYWFNFPKSIFYHFDHQFILVFFGKLHAFDLFKNEVMGFFKFKTFCALPYSAFTFKWQQLMLFPISLVKSVCFFLTASFI